MDKYQEIALAIVEDCDIVCDLAGKIDTELCNYDHESLMDLCRSVDGDRHVFTDPLPDLKKDIDDIIRQLATNALNSYCMKVWQDVHAA